MCQGPLRGRDLVTGIGKSEVERIDQFVAEGLRLIGLPANSDASLPSIPPQLPRASEPTENVPTFKVTIGNASR
jgi:hypothetical protein